MLGPGAKLQVRKAKRAPLPAPTLGASARPVSLGNHMCMPLVSLPG